MEWSAVIPGYFSSVSPKILSLDAQYSAFVQFITTEVDRKHIAFATIYFYHKNIFSDSLPANLNDKLERIAWKWLRSHKVSCEISVIKLFFSEVRLAVTRPAHGLSNPVHFVRAAILWQTVISNFTITNEWQATHWSVFAISLVAILFREMRFNLLCNYW